MFFSSVASKLAEFASGFGAAGVLVEGRDVFLLCF